MGTLPTPREWPIGLNVPELFWVGAHRVSRAGYCALRNEDFFREWRVDSAGLARLYTPSHGAPSALRRDGAPSKLTHGSV